MRLRGIIDRIRWMIRVKDCRSVCLFCEFYEQCREELAGIEEETES